MPDLLTHVLATYACGVVIVAFRPGLNRYVGVAVIGAMVPDLAKLHLLSPVQHALEGWGLTYAFWGLHTIGGVAVIALLIGIWAVADKRWAVAATMCLAGAGHLVLDALIIRADGLVPPYGYPVTWWQPAVPGGGLYLSSNQWPLLVALGAVGLALAVRRVTARPG